MPLPYVELSPGDACRLGVKNGDIVMVYNDQGNETFAVFHETDAVPDGMVFALMGIGSAPSNSLDLALHRPDEHQPVVQGARVGIRKLAGSLPSVMQTTSFLPTNDFS